MEMPWEYTEMVLCRDIYHCVPSQLDREDYERIMRHLDMYNTEQDVKHKRQKAQDEHDQNLAKRRPRRR